MRKKFSIVRWLLIVVANVMIFGLLGLSIISIYFFVERSARLDAELLRNPDMPVGFFRANEVAPLIHHRPYSASKPRCLSSCR